MLGWRPMAATPQDLQATFAATLVDEWARGGVLHAVVAPGSRSTPLALALADHAAIELHVHHDERSASFLALGLALATGVPVVVVTTSGTAAAQLHAAVVEADLARVPLLVCTADRPPELQDVGAPQAIDQTHLFGGAVRWFHEPGVADAASAQGWRPLARRALAATMGRAQGPVHLNLAFREPLLGTADVLPEDAPAGDPADARAWAEGLLTPAMVAMVHGLVGCRGILVAGPGSGPGWLVDAVAQALGWPVLAAPQAPVWGVPDAVVPAADTMLRNDWLAEALRPEVVVRLGTPLASKVVGEWIAASGAHEIVVAGPDRWIDPHGSADVVLPVEPEALLDSWKTALHGAAPVADGVWLEAWSEAGESALAAVEATLPVLLRESGPTEPGIVHDIVEALPDGTELVVSSSMPVRDLEWFARPRSGLRVHANRGANGIDGVVSTAVGVAAGSRRPTVLLIGDVAFLHDSNGLLGLARRPLDLVIVVIDNDGGGIFSFLPQAGVLARDRFEALFGTPHGLDLVALASGFGVAARAVTAKVGEQVAASLAAGGVHVLVVGTERGSNVEVHDALHAAVERVLSAAADG